MLNDLHEEIDTRAAAVAATHRDRMVCRKGCFGCCVDEIMVFEIEAEKIRRGAAELLATATPHAPGRCAFLGHEGECRIYELRPYVCRTQGLPLRWIDEDAEAEYRDICSLNDEAGAPLEELSAEECWTVGEFEERLARLNGSSKRVALRELWSAGVRAG
jgi:Fe-S-cluster containining protein